MAPGLAASRYAQPTGASTPSEGSSAALRPTHLGTLKESTRSRSSRTSAPKPANGTPLAAAVKAEGSPNTLSPTPKNESPTDTNLAQPDGDEPSFPSAAPLEPAPPQAPNSDTVMQSAASLQAISSWLQHSHRFMSQICKSLNKEGGLAATHAQLIDTTWQQLERLYDSAMQGKPTGQVGSGPVPLYKMAENLGLAHAEKKPVEVKQEERPVPIPDVLKQVLQQKDIVIHEHTEGRDKILRKLEARTSRLTLEQGLMKQEVEDYKSKYAKANAAHDQATKDVAALRTEVEALANSKNLFQAANERLASSSRDLQAKLNETQERIAHYEKELRRLSEEIEQYKGKAGLEQRLKASLAAEAALKEENQRLKQDYEALRNKARDQAIEFAKLFKKNEEQAKEIRTLTDGLEKLKTGTRDLQERVARMDEVEKANATLRKTSADLQGQVKTLEQALENTKNENTKMKEEAEAKIKDLEKLVSLKDQNADLYSSPMQDKSGGAALMGLQNQLQESQEQVQHLQKLLDEWKELGTESYSQYASMKPLYDEAVDKIKEYVGREKEIERLKAELHAAKATGITNGNNDPDAVAYWKGKYENLLANIHG